MKSEFKPRGWFFVKHYNKVGKLIGVYQVPNGIVDVGLNKILDDMYDGGGAAAPSALWYLGLVDNFAWTSWSDADTMGGHAGWAESQAYAAATRPQWTVGAAAARQVTNAATVDFAINDTKTLKGIFVADNNVKGGAAGTLWATAAFSSTVSVENGDTLKITYTVSG